jgi:drug/metabolite transporter (DMT)-like permease
MAQLPISMRRNKTTAVQTPSSTNRWEHASWWGSWLLVILAVILCGVGFWTMLNTIRHAPAATVKVVGDLNPLQQQLLQKKLQPLVKEGFFTTDL